MRWCVVCGKFLCPQCLPTNRHTCQPGLEPLLARDEALGAAGEGPKRVRWGRENWVSFADVVPVPSTLEPTRVMRANSHDELTCRTCLPVVVGVPGPAASHAWEGGDDDKQELRSMQATTAHVDQEFLFLRLKKRTKFVSFYS